MSPVKEIRNTAIPWWRENIDTDQIIPARYLKAISLEQGYGEVCFRDVRFDAEGNPDPNCVFNTGKYQGSVLVTGPNFGCGSSREHAAWALRDFGIEVVISSQFADIFRANACHNGIIPAEVDEAAALAVLRIVEAEPTTEIVVDLETQTVSIPAHQWKASFTIPTFSRQCLLEGKSPFEWLLAMDNEITAFENARPQTTKITTPHPEVRAGVQLKFR